VTLPVAQDYAGKMGLKLTDLYRAPEINPINRKARSVPFFNPINMYGRVFFFSWFGFMIAFWAWYTFPPLVSSHPAALIWLVPGLTFRTDVRDNQK
jgi:MFS transporter, NNP family, nitrate/nitrite transporter